MGRESGDQRGQIVRSHTASQIVLQSVGERVTLAGWVDRRRHHGGVAFVDLRDHTGVVQVVMEPQRFEESVLLRREYCIQVHGVIRRRPEGAENPAMSSGMVEMDVEELTILSPSEELPFPIEDRTDAEELLRLEYRYLDLRRPRMARNLAARSLALRTVRRTLEDMAFWEVETPTLIRSTPEGARDLLVPSRHNPGAFYALPQSPQIYKQLLMVAGVDRYYQMCRCYRDEDFRADRQLEFTQIDLEGAFWDQDDVLAAVEKVVMAVASVLRPDQEIPVPLPRLTYGEAMARYGTDKPDVRFGMQIQDLSDVFAGTGFRAFANILGSGGVVRGINAGQIQMSRARADALIAKARQWGAGGLVWMVVRPQAPPRSPVAKFLSQVELDSLVERMGGTPGDVLLLVADREKTAAQTLGRLRLDLGTPDDPDSLEFLWVVDFPMFEEKDGEITFLHHPFTSPTDVEQMVSRPLESVARSYDLVLNGVELGSGSVRIHDPDTQRRVFEIMGIPEEEAEERFGWFIKALRYGAPPHAGFAVGFDRLVAVLRGVSSIREIIPFPKTQTGAEPLSSSPAAVDREQLAELGIAVAPRRARAKPSG
ncbi:MAG: aspartate--tRNA ligase [Acidimicrobiia bacterium]|nr:aspartate--tRNA ligase [Acidimicrobiia bacterium]